MTIRINELLDSIISSKKNNPRLLKIIKTKIIL